MLRYYRFVGNEFVYIGQTEGNEHRIAKDMTYLVKKALAGKGTRSMPQGGGGIMTLQRGYASQLLKYMETCNRSLGDIIECLQFSPEHLDQDTWEALYRLNRKPKPCYMAGLTSEAQEFLARRGSIMNQAPTRQTSNLRKDCKTFVFKNVNVSAQAKLAQSNDSRKIQDAFGFVGTTLNAEIISNTSFALTQGTVTIVCGASGSGKSLLGYAIRFLCGEDSVATNCNDSESEVNYSVLGSVNPKARVVEFQPYDESLNALEQVNSSDLEFFFEVCARCGLAEPQLFVRPIESLSSGQKYRLQIAGAFLQMPDIVYIDNFCESLDRHTAVAVCIGLTRLVESLGVAAIVSTAAYESLINILKPQQTILLRRGNAPIVSADIRREKL